VAAGLDSETLHEILHADHDRDGKVTYDDLLTHLQSLVSTRRQYRRAARFLGLLVLFLIIIITAIVVGTALTLKDTTVDGNGIFVTYNVLGEREPIATASVENAFGVVSNEESFDNLKPLLQEGPTRLALQFDDESFLQFEPRFIQVFDESATVANKEVGVTLRLRAGSSPIVEYTVAQSQFTQQSTPSLTGTTSRASAAAVRLITLYSPRVRPLVESLGTGTEAAPTTPTTTSENQKAAFVAANNALKKDVIADVQLSLETQLSLRAKQLRGDDNQYVLLGVNATDVPAVCEYVTSAGGACGHNASLGDYYVGVAEQFGFLPLTATENARAAIKAWVRESGNPYNISGFEPRFKAEMASVIVHADGAPHPVHKALHQSAHRALLGSAVGQRRLRRHLEALQPHEREHMNARMRKLAEAEAAEEAEAAAAATAPRVRIVYGKTASAKAAAKRAEAAAARKALNEAVERAAAASAAAAAASAAASAAIVEVERATAVALRAADDALEAEAEAQLHIAKAEAEAETESEAQDTQAGASRADTRMEADESHAADDHVDRRAHARGLLPVEFRNANAKMKKEHVTCYSPTEPQLYEGSDVDYYSEAGEKGVCAPWKEFVASSAVCQSTGADLSEHARTSCFCEHFGFATRLVGYYEPLTGNSPRAPCEGMQKPMCVQAGGNNSWVLRTPAVPECSEAYFTDVLKRNFLPFSTQVPVFDDDWNWNLERVVKWSASYGSEGAYPDLAFCGEGVHVFVIDSGINANHRDFLDARGNSRIGTSYNAFDRVECAPGDMGACMDTGGHGTHVAGTVAGRRYGLASCATVHAVKISEGHAGASIDFLEAGIDWLIRYHNANIRWKWANGKKLRSVVVASLNAEAPVSHLNSMFVKLTWNGVAVSVAAGNNDVDACQSSPASAGGKSGSAVVTVAASAIDDSKAPYSNWGSCVDLFAPGTGIASAAAPDVTDGYTVMSGTSMAAPLVAGVMALVSEAYPNYSPLVIKYWLIWNSRQGLIDAVVPSSVVSDAYLRDILKRPGALTVKELNYLTRATQVECIGGRCVAEDAHNIDATPNLLLRIPRNDLAKTSWWSRQRRLSEATADTDTDTDVNVSAVQEEPLLVCNWTVGVLDGAECPPKGAAVCGELRGHDPLGASVLRPFVRKHAVCADGCWCDPDAPEASYEEYVSCVGNPKYPNDYEYSGEACSPVYVLDRASEVEALQDKTLVYAPLPGGVAFNAPQVLAGEGVVDAFATATSEGEIQMDGETLYMTRPVKLPIGTDSSLKRSLWSHETFSFFGHDYETIYVSENGYICFTESNVQAATPSIDEHFSAARGPCFSVFLSDLAFDSRGAAGIYLTHIFAGAVAPYTPRATVVTYYLAHGDGDTSGNTFSVQARFEYFSNSVRVSFDKQLPTTLSAVVGPSAGAVPRGFAPSSAHELVFG